MASVIRLLSRSSAPECSSDCDGFRRPKNRARIIESSSVFVSQFIIIILTLSLLAYRQHRVHSDRVKQRPRIWPAFRPIAFQTFSYSSSLFWFLFSLLPERLLLRILSPGCCPASPIFKIFIIGPTVRLSGFVPNPLVRCSR